MTIDSQEETTMRALRFNEFGGPAVLHVEDVARRRRLELMGPYFESGRFRPTTPARPTGRGDHKAGRAVINP